MSFQPKLSILPSGQRSLWPRLKSIPQTFVLYGGTAIALRLAHRASVGFDFFSSQSFHPDQLTQAVPFLGEGERLQSQPNTLTVLLSQANPVKISFFGGLSMGRVGIPDQAPDNGVWVGSLLDLAAMKMAVVQQRAEKKDYVDIHAILSAGISLEQALGAAKALYGRSFNPAITLKALTWFNDGDLPSVTADVRSFLLETAAKIGSLPAVPRLSDSFSP